jgi:hypothetical protein
MLHDTDAAGVRDGHFDPPRSQLYEREREQIAAKSPVSGLLKNVQIQGARPIRIGTPFEGLRVPSNVEGEPVPCAFDLVSFSGVTST